MGRAVRPWLQRAYDVCADGRWHLRDVVLAEMVKTVPPGMAYRRGVATTKTGLDRLSQQQLVDRGARHICLVSLMDSRQVQVRTRGGQVFMRRAGGEPDPLPIVLEPVSRDRATHALVPIEAFSDRVNRSADVHFVAVHEHPQLPALDNRSDR